MFKKLMVIILGILSIGLTGCELETPEIRGVVLDAETKQPIEEAWITATLKIKVRTAAGDVSKYLAIEKPHTRTDKYGKFAIPAKIIEKPSFPVGFGTEVTSFGVGASTIDDRAGSVDLKPLLGKNEVETIIFVKPEHTKDTEGEYFIYLQGLYSYCLTGRFSAEIPAEEGGCDKWELNYAIIKHERFLDRLSELKNSDQKARYANVLNQLGYLYEKRDDFQEAIKTYRKLMDFEGPGGWFFKKAQYRINELQKKLEEKKP